VAGEQQRQQQQQQQVPIVGGGARRDLQTAAVAFAAGPNTGRCAISKSTISATSIVGTYICVMCLVGYAEDRVYRMNMPCGHVTMCASCEEMPKRRSREMCYVCKERVQRTLPVSFGPGTTEFCSCEQFNVECTGMREVLFVECGCFNECQPCSQFFEFGCRYHKRMPPLKWTTVRVATHPSGAVLS
jgi:hypothetical protein